MFRKPLTIALIALVALTGTLVAPRDASAGSQVTEAARKAAMQAHRLADTKTQQVARLQARYAGEVAQFNASVATGKSMTIHYAKQRFIGYLNGLQGAIRQAITAHHAAIRSWEHYNRVGRTTGGNGSILALGAAIRRFQATLNQAQVDKNAAGNVR